MAVFMIAQFPISNLDSGCTCGCVYSPSGWRGQEGYRYCLLATAHDLEASSELGYSTVHLGGKLTGWEGQQLVAAIEICVWNGVLCR